MVINKFQLMPLYLVRDVNSFRSIEAFNSSSHLVQENSGMVHTSTLRDCVRVFLHMVAH